MPKPVQQFGQVTSTFLAAIRPGPFLGCFVLNKLGASKHLLNIKKAISSVTPPQEVDSLFPVLFIICATGDKTMKQGGISFRLFRNDDAAKFCKAKLGDSDLSCTRTFPERRRSEQKKAPKTKKEKNSRFKESRNTKYRRNRKLRLPWPHNKILRL